MGPISFKRHRFPPAVIRYAVCYFRLTLSFRGGEELLAQRGIEVSYETIRCRTLKFGPLIAANLQCRRSPPSGRVRVGDLISENRRKLNLTSVIFGGCM